MQQQSALDRFATKCESSASYYLSNQDQLYRLLTTWSLVTYTFWTVWHLLNNIRYYNVIIDSPSVGLWLVASLLSNFFLIILVLGTRSRINAKQTTGITLAAIFLIANLLTLHLILVCFGLYAFLNTPFRQSVHDWAPQWYLNLSKSLD